MGESKTSTLMTFQYCIKQGRCIIYFEVRKDKLRAYIQPQAYKFVSCIQIVSMVYIFLKKGQIQ